MHRDLKISKTCLLGCAVALAVFAGAGLAPAKGLSLLYAFKGEPDAASPLSGLTMDSAGNLYGGTYWGGGTGCYREQGCGTVYKLAPDGTETVLYAFQDSSDGAGPSALVLDKKGNLYGTAAYGGTSYVGTVFKLTTAGKEKVLHSFTCGNGDAAYPSSPPVADSAGNLYGTTSYVCLGNGRYGGYGTVYKLAPDGTETELYTFKGAPDGEYPGGALVVDKADNLYGTTQRGGTGNCWEGCGTVFKVTSNGTESVLYSFQEEPDGWFPLSGVIVDKDRNLYGTTEVGGNAGCSGNDGCGTVFELAADGTETVLYSFGASGSMDGNEPAAGLIRDKSGNLFGTTNAGGTHGKGTVFELAPDGSETVLASFACAKDGCSPQSALLADGAGNLYGTASKGGLTACKKGCGTVFKIKQ